MKLIFFPTSTTIELEFFELISTVFYLTEQNSNSASFSPSQCCRSLKVSLLSRFSSEVDVVLGEVQCPSQVSSPPLLVKFAMEWLPFLM